MSGHNKFSKIKHKKAASDAAKSKAFSMYGKMIAVKSKDVGGDTEHPALRALIAKAKKMNMPNDTIDRAVKKGAGGDTGNMQEVLYEAYGPGGVALIIEGVTDNTNRTVNEVKSTVTKAGGSLGAQGSVTWAFGKEKDEDGSIVWQPNASNQIDLDDDVIEKLSKLVEALEELEDVKSVTTNAA